MADTVNVHEAKTHLSRLLEQVESGERITIARAGKPIADLVPHVRADFQFGLARGQLVYDSATFDDPDPETIELFEAAGSDL